MKKLLALLLVLTLVFPVALLTGCAKYDDELKIYNWGDYIYDVDLEDFQEYYTQKTGRTIKITYTTFDTNEIMLTKVLNDSAEVDVICPSEYAIQKLVENNKLRVLNYFDDPNDEYLNEDNVDADFITRVQQCFADKSYDLTQYMVPYMFGTLGVLYNTSAVSQADAEAAGWGLLWNEKMDGSVLSANLAEKIFMKDSIRDSYAAAVLYLKERGKLPTSRTVDYSALTVEQLINTVDDTLLDAAEEVFIEQKNVLLGYEVDLGKNDLIKGRALAGLAWSGDAMYSIEEAAEGGVELDYFVPAIGGNVWFDGWVIPTSCPDANLPQAKMFIDWLNNPEIAMANMIEIGYSSAADKTVLAGSETAYDTYLANMLEYEYDDGKWFSVDENEQKTEVSAEELLAAREEYDEFFNDIRRYPDVTATNLGVMQDFGANNEKVVTMWSKVKSSGFNVLALVLIIVGIAVVGVAVFLFLKLRKRGGKRVKVS